MNTDTQFPDNGEGVHTDSLNFPSILVEISKFTRDLLSFRKKVYIRPYHITESTFERNTPRTRDLLIAIVNSNRGNYNRGGDFSRGREGPLVYYVANRSLDRSRGTKRATLLRTGVQINCAGIRLARLRFWLHHPLWLLKSDARATGRASCDSQPTRSTPIISIRANQNLIALSSADAYTAREYIYIYTRPILTTRSFLPWQSCCFLSQLPVPSFFSLHPPFFPLHLSSFLFLSDRSSFSSGN